MAKMLSKYEEQMVGFMVRAWREGGARKRFGNAKEAGYAKFMLYRAMKRAIELGGGEEVELERVKEEVALRVEGDEVVAYVKANSSVFAGFEGEERYELDAVKKANEFGRKLFEELEKGKEGGKADSEKRNGSGAAAHREWEGEREGAAKAGDVSQVDVGYSREGGGTNDSVGGRDAAGGVARGTGSAKGADNGPQEDARKVKDGVYVGEGERMAQKVEEVYRSSQAGRGREAEGEVAREKRQILGARVRGESEDSAVDGRLPQTGDAGNVAEEMREIQPGVGGVPTLKELMRREWEKQQKLATNAEEILARHSKDS